MKLLALVTSLSLSMSMGTGMAQIHTWPKNDPDPYFQKKKDLEKHSQKDRRNYPQKYSKKYPQENRK